MAGLRFWRNTRVADLTAGQMATLVPGTLGYEWGEELDNGFRPPASSGCRRRRSPAWKRSSTSARTVGLGTATHSLTLYRHNSGALVFGASTVQWAWGLDGDHDGGSPTRTCPIRRCSRRP